jgi:Lhr-like helicase
MTLRRNDNIRTDFRKIRWQVVDGIHQALDRDRVLLNTLMELRILLKTGHFVTSRAIFSVSSTKLNN